MQIEKFIHDLEALILSDNQVETTELCIKEKELIKENSFDVLEAITEHITEANEQENPARLQLAVELLSMVTEVCSYDDVLLCLYKTLADTLDDTTFVHLLEPLKIALTKTPEHKFKYAIWCFDAIKTFVANLPTPQTANISEPERSSQTDEDIELVKQRIVKIFTKIVDFYETVAPKFTTESNNLLVRKYMLQLLGKPLCFMDLNPDEECFSFTERIINLTTENCDPFKYLTWLNYKSTDEEDLKVDRLALANYFYLILVLNVHKKKIPKVYDNVFVFRHIMYYLTELFNYDQQYVIEKGLLLADYVLNVKNLPHQLLDDEIHSKFTGNLSKVIVFSSIKENRQKALEVFRKYILSFDQRGKYLIIHNAFNVVEHSGLMGYLITVYKDLIVDEFKNQNIGEFFRGAKLEIMIMQFCHLQKQENSDMMELADQIIPALNLLRYLAIRDKQDATGIKKLLPIISKVFLEPLKKGLVISKSHYGQQIKQINDEPDSDKNTPVTVTVGGKDMPSLARKDKLNMLNTSITVFDVMESLLARLNECVQNC